MRTDPGRSVPPQRASRLANSATFRLTIAVIVVGTLAAAQAGVPHPDLAFYVYAAGRVLDGAVLYRDIVEINPPLIIWLNLPVAALERLLGISGLLIYRIIVALLIGGVLLFCGRLADHTTVAERGRAPYPLLLGWFALFPLAGDDFGQREHLLLALMLPYLMVLVARVEGRRVPPAQALTAGMLAGAGLALKPYFVLAWAAVEGFRRARASAGRWDATPELVGTVLAIAVYLALVIGLTPDYFRIIGLLGPAYARFMQRPLLDVAVLSPAMPRVLFALLAFAALRRSGGPAALPAVLAAAVIGSWGAAVLQHKGFSYHYYPALALAFVLLGLLAAPAMPPRSWVTRTYLRLTRAVAATIVIVAAGTTLAGVLRPQEEGARALAELAATVRSGSKGRPVGVLSYTINSAFPLMNEAGTTLASRFPCLWPLAASYWDSLTAGGDLRHRAPADMTPAERFMWDAVRHDLITMRPNLLILLRPGKDVPHNGLRRLNYVAYFGRRPELAEFFNAYQLIDRQGEYLVYERVPDGAARLGPPPSADPGTLEAPRPAVPALGLALLDGHTRTALLAFALVLLGLLVADRVRPAGEPEPPMTV